MLDAAIPPFISPNGPALSAIAAAGATVYFPNVVDILGYGVGQAPSANIIGNPPSGFFGQDVGLGIWKLDIEIDIGTSFTTSNSATAEFVLQGAPDTGAAGAYQPGTWEDFATTGTHAASELVTATLSAGRFRMAMPPAPPATLTPRYLRMLMRVPSATNFTAGTITGAYMVQGRDDLQSAQQSANNYVVK